jgi:hypothetical protein
MRLDNQAVFVAELTSSCEALLDKLPEITSATSHRCSLLTSSGALFSASGGSGGRPCAVPRGKTLFFCLHGAKSPAPRRSLCALHANSNNATNA